MGRPIHASLCQRRPWNKVLWFVAIFILCAQRPSIHMFWEDDPLPSPAPTGTQPSTQSRPTKAQTLRFSRRKVSSNKVNHNKVIPNKVKPNIVIPPESPRTRKLVPPFKIFQVGTPRTGSTFQYHLLQAIVALKSPPGTVVKSLYVKDDFFTDYASLRKYMRPDQTFVIKSHSFPVAKERRQQWNSNNVTVFASSTGFSYALYTHNQKRILDCPICEIDSYIPIFDLTSDDVKLLKSYISDFSIIRRCCGMQMSKYEILRLNGCNMTKHAYNIDYPKCEQYNLTHVEHHFANNPIPFTPLYPEYNWAKPGDCDRFQAMIQGGLGFNGQSVTSCTLPGSKH